jgi:glycosyltransferase involved in cell wall biosynthesis
VQPGDADALAAQIARLLRDPTLRASLSAAARQAAVARFDRARMAEELLTLYRELG